MTEVSSNWMGVNELAFTRTPPARTQAQPAVVRQVSFWFKTSITPCRSRDCSIVLSPVLDQVLYKNDPRLKGARRPHVGSLPAAGSYHLTNMILHTSYLGLGLALM